MSLEFERRGEKEFEEITVESFPVLVNFGETYIFKKLSKLLLLHRKATRMWTN